LGSIRRRILTRRGQSFPRRHVSYHEIDGAAIHRNALALCYQTHLLEEVWQVGNGTALACDSIKGFETSLDRMVPIEGGYLDHDQLSLGVEHARQFSQPGWIVDEGRGKGDNHSVKDTPCERQGAGISPAEVDIEPIAPESSARKTQHVRGQLKAEGLIAG
jgi:hypothetical protein